MPPVVCTLVAVVLCRSPTWLSQQDRASCLKGGQDMGGMMDSYLAAVENTKTILLTTYKRDGTAVATPVSIAFDGDRALWPTGSCATRPCIMNFAPAPNKPIRTCRFWGDPGSRR